MCDDHVLTRCNKLGRFCKFVVEAVPKLMHLLCDRKYGEACVNTQQPRAGHDGVEELCPQEPSRSLVAVRVSLSMRLKASDRSSDY